MTITDAQIQALKELMHERPTEGIAQDVVCDLLNRLAAAEKIANRYSDHDAPCDVYRRHIGTCSCGFATTLTTWRASKGLP